MLPFAFLRPLRLRCPHCQREETVMRGEVTGTKHFCVHCKKPYVVDAKTKVSSSSPKR